MTQATELVNVFIYGEINALRPLNSGTAAPDKHDNKDCGSHKNGKVAAVEELGKA